MDSAISMVVLRGPVELMADSIVADLADRWPDVPASSLEARGEVATLSFGPAMLALAAVSAPIPWAELEGPSETSSLWPGAAEPLREHQAHLIVALNGDVAPLELFTLLVKATTSALCLMPGALGVYMGSAGMVIAKDLFVEYATDVLPSGPPLHLLVDFRVGWNDDKTSGGFTSGLAALGHMEFETLRSPENPSDLMERFVDCASYVLGHGPVIGNGHTVGSDTQERIRVVYRRSAFGLRGKVMRLEYEQLATRKKWWHLGGRHS